LEEVNEVVFEHMEDVDLDVEHLAKYMNLSRPTLYRKLKAITDLTPNEIINISRLKKAAVFLSEGAYNINEISEKVGYTSPTHFGRNFQRQFGMTPSDYLRRKE
jgi:AraC-like DNA-binding protein